MEPTAAASILPLPGVFARAQPKESFKPDIGGKRHEPKTPGSPCFGSVGSPPMSSPSISRNLRSSWGADKELSTPDSALHKNLPRQSIHGKPLNFEHRPVAAIRRDSTIKRQLQGDFCGNARCLEKFEECGEKIMQLEVALGREKQVKWEAVMRAARTPELVESLLSQTAECDPATTSNEEGDLVVSPNRNTGSPNPEARRKKRRKFTTGKVKAKSGFVDVERFYWKFEVENGEFHNIQGLCLPL